MSASQSTETNAGTQRKGARKARAKAGARRTAAMKTAAADKPVDIPNGAARRAVPARNGTPPAVLLDLVQTLPPIGSKFSKEKRDAWTKAAAATFDLIYEPDIKAAA